jgi:hypothetical protein
MRKVILTILSLTVLAAVFYLLYSQHTKKNFENYCKKCRLEHPACFSCCDINNYNCP